MKRSKSERAIRSEVIASVVQSLEEHAVQLRQQEARADRTSDRSRLFWQSEVLCDVARTYRIALKLNMPKKRTKKS